jgi:hypothetical protein
VLSQVLPKVKALTQARDDLSKFDTLSRLQWYLHLFRGQHKSLRAICKKERECLKDNITVEREDPVLMAEQLSHCNELWNTDWRTKDKGPSNVWNNNGKRPMQQIGKPYAQQPLKGTNATAPKTFQQALGKGDATVKTDYLKVLGWENLTHTPTETCTTLWLKDWNRKRIEHTKKNGLCLLCGQKGHQLQICKQRLDMYRD